MGLHKAVKELGGRPLLLPEGGLKAHDHTPIPGARLSDPCGACRIIRLFDKDFPDYFPEGVATQGHMIEALFIQNLLEPLVTVDRQYRIDWGAGTTGLDAVVWKSEYRAHYELKTSSDKLYPTKDNIQQVTRQRAVAELAGVDLPPSVIFVVGKSGRNSMRVGDAYPVIPSTEDLDAVKREIRATNLIVQDIKDTGLDPRQHGAVKLLRKSGCYSCFPLDKETATGPALELIAEWCEMMPMFKEAKDWKDEFTEKAKLLVSDLPVGEYELQGSASLRVYESGRHKFVPWKAKK